MLNVLVIEDEAPALQRICRLLGKVAPETRVAGTADSVAAASGWLARNPAPDLILADIQLSDGCSIDWFQAQPPACPVIFTTAHDSYLLEAFATHGIAYLLKPVKGTELAAAIVKYRSLGRHFTANISALGDHSSASRAPRRRVLVQKGLSFRPVSIDDIAYLFSEHKLTFLVTTAGDRFLVNESLTQLEVELDEGAFFRLNRNFVARIDAVRSFRSIGKGRIAVELHPAPAEEVQVSQERASQFRAWAARG